MQIVFGWGLDGLSYPETASGKSAAFNSAVFGPAGMLGLLEQRLGLTRSPIVRAVRVAEYLALLHSVNDGKRFYSNSLNADPWATAEFLLGVRDELLVAGWDGKPVEQLDKVRTLSAVESGGAVSAGFGERLREVNGILGKTSARAPLTKLQVVGAIHKLPPIWRSTIKLLQDLGSTVEESLPIPRACGGDLLKLQNRLMSGGGAEKISFAGDGTISVIDADDEVQSAEITAAWLANQHNVQDLVLIRGADSSILSQACDRYALSKVGNTTRSQFRAVLQVLPLAFELAWRPLDPKKIVELLCIEGGPIPGWVSKNLIDALGQAPGVGGAEWNRAWQKCVERQGEWIMRDNPGFSSDEVTRQSKEKLRHLQAWFEEKVPAGTSTIQIEDAISICERVEKWAAGRATFETNSALHEVAAGHAKMLRRLFQRSSTGSNRIPLTQLRRMIDAVTGYGVSMSNTEASPWSLIDQPGQIWDCAPTVLWWGFAQAHWPAFRTGFWTESDAAILNENAIEVEYPLQRLRRESDCWRMPILNATERLVLVKPRVVSGQRTIAHPLWDEITSTLDEHSLRKITVSAASIFADPQVVLAGTGITCEPRSPVTLPGPLRTWTVPPKAVPIRKEESFSSIDKLLGCPLAWVLNYGCRMRQPNALNLPEKQLLLGKLAHAVVNEMYEHKKDWAPDEARDFSSRTLQEFIPQAAAGLLLPGAGPQLREATEAIPDSIAQLVSFLRGANATVEGCELSLKARINSDTVLAGNVDMLARLPDNRRIVLDFKWSSSPFWYRRKIVDGKALQLAIYSWLATQSLAEAEKSDTKPPDQGGLPNSSDLTPSGYFMFRHSQLFFTSEGVFPNYTVVRKMARGLDKTWEATLQAYERVLGTVRSGTVIATAIDDGNIEIENFMVEKLNDPPCMFCEFGHFCGKTELQ